MLAISQHNALFFSKKNIIVFEAKQGSDNLSEQPNDGRNSTTEKNGAKWTVRGFVRAHGAVFLAGERRAPFRIKRSRNNRWFTICPNEICLFLEIESFKITSRFCRGAIRFPTSRESKRLAAERARQKAERKLKVEIERECAEISNFSFAISPRTFRLRTRELFCVESL